MDWLHNLLFCAFLLLAAAIDGIKAAATVTGTVFCDQCKDGHLSLFDYPMSGIKVTMACADSTGQITMSREETTNWFGSYAIRLDGSPDLSNCYAMISSGGQRSSGCNFASGPAQKLRLMFRMFNMEMYNVDALLSQPASPMSFCPRSTDPVSAPPVNPATPPAPVAPEKSPPQFRPPPVRPPAPVAPEKSPPQFRLPPMPKLPPLPPLPPMPPMPFVEASACTYKDWTNPDYKCYWRAINPEMKVAVVFGLPAARRYGTDMTLWQGMQGRDDPYRTLLREGTTALLNSYNSLQFPYNSISVLTHMNGALMGSERNVVLTALRFMRANSGYEKVTCKFTPCK